MGDGGGLAYGRVLERVRGERHGLAFTGGFGTRTYMSKNIESVAVAGDGTRYQKTLIMAGEAPEAIEGRHRSGGGQASQAFEQPQQAGAA